MEKPTNPQPSEKAKDLAFATIKGGISLIPGIGPIAAEILQTLIPNRRMERVEQFLTVVSERTAHLTPEFLSQKMKDTEFVDVLEEGIYQASRAKLETRLKMLANMVTAGVCGYADTVLIGKYLKILDTLDDSEILLLCRISVMSDDGIPVNDSSLYEALYPERSNYYNEHPEENYDDVWISHRNSINRLVNFGLVDNETYKDYRVTYFGQDLYFYTDEFLSEANIK